MPEDTIQQAPEAAVVECTPPPDPPQQLLRYTWLQLNQRPLVGLITVVGVLGLYYMFVLGKYNAESEKILLIVLGSLPGFMGYVLQYLFGGTATSDRARQQMSGPQPSPQGDGVRYVRSRTDGQGGQQGASQGS